MIQKTTRKRIPKIIPGMIRKVLNKRNRKLLILAVIGTVSVQAVVTTAAAARSFADKGEVNGDQIVDYSDVELLELYLIHQLDLDEKAIKNADVNSDGQITVTDLTLLVQKLEKKLDYTVSLTDPGQDIMSILQLSIIWIPENWKIIQRIIQESYRQKRLWSMYGIISGRFPISRPIKMEKKVRHSQRMKGSGWDSSPQM